MDDLDNKLLVVFNNVNEWLRFAEAKNAMLIAFNGVVFFGVTQMLELPLIREYVIFKWYFYILLLSLAFSVLIALLSFIPRLKQVSPTFNFKKESNFLYFECLRHQTPDKIIELYRTGSSEATDFQIHLAQQIISNSGVTKRKYDYFTFGTWLTISGIATIVVAAILFVYNYKK